MISTINVQAFLKYLGNGVSQPAIIIGDDFNNYVLKTQRVYENGKTEIYDSMFLNELLSYQIAKYLDVPIPESCIAYVHPKLGKDPEVRFVQKFLEGNHFASAEISNVENNLLDNFLELKAMGKKYLHRSWSKVLNDIKNCSDIPKIICLDLLIANFDRYSNDGNLIVSNDENGRYLYAIDHGHSFFGPFWDLNKKKMLRESTDPSNFIPWYLNQIVNLNEGYLDGLGNVFKSLELTIDLNDLKNHDFYEIVAKIELINEDLIDSWMSNIPDEWFKDKPIQIAYYKTFLLRNARYIRHYIQHLANNRIFTNYAGGALEWKNLLRAGSQ